MARKRRSAPLYFARYEQHPFGGTVVRGITADGHEICDGVLWADRGVIGTGDKATATTYAPLPPYGGAGPALWGPRPTGSRNPLKARSAK